MLEPLSYEVEPGLYQHYKGTLYRVLGTGRHSETLEELVFYKEEDGDLLWARPAPMFLEEIEIDGKSGKRFIKQ